MPTLVSYESTWTQKKLASLNGSMPVSGLLLAKNGKLYGTTAKGGAYGVGSVFELTR